MHRWSTLLVDEASFDDLGKIATANLAMHSELVAAQGLRPRELYDRWEKQQWSAEAVDLGVDRENFERRLPRSLKHRLEQTISTFIVGEYTGLDLLSPIAFAAQDENDLVFLGTQIADEARHARLMFRIGHEVLGYDEDPRAMLARAWGHLHPDHQSLAVLEGQIMRESVESPRDYAKWLRCVTMFHLITEGVLAISGQRSVVRELGKSELLPGVRSAFAAMCRDESRHISFGLHALRIGFAEGFGDVVFEVLERALPLALAMTEQIQPSSMFLRAKTEADQFATQTGLESFWRAMRVIGANPQDTKNLVDRSLRIVRTKSNQGDGNANFGS